MSDGDTDLLGVVRALAQAGPGLGLDVNLAVTIDGTRLAVSSRQGRLYVQAPSLGACLRLARRQRGRLAELAGLLADAGQTVELRVGGATVAVLGAGARPGPLSRRLGLGPVRLRPQGAVAAALRLR